MVATEASYLVKYVTRFTEEIFAFLISMIFLYEVLVKLIKVCTYIPFTYIVWSIKNCTFLNVLTLKCITKFDYISQFMMKIT